MLRPLLVLFTLTILLSSETFAADRKPNIIVILSDDLGYGDVGCYGATKVKTPNLDKLAAEGLRFTDGHCTSSTCTPSRYSLLTGEYAWRKKGTGILPGDAKMIIEPGRATLPAVLKSAGYATGAVGKWHLGLGDGKVDWNGEIKPGPLEIGFDYCFIMPATGDRVPCVYLENHRIVGLDANDPLQVNYDHKIGDEPTGKANPDLLKMKLSHGHDNTIINGISRIGFMSGGKAARWSDEDMADTLTKKATAFIEKHKDEPFFLYFAPHDIHVPRVPHARYAGKSQCGIRGDVIEQCDGSVGEVVTALNKLKLSDNTLLIFTSDNGPVIDDGYADGAVKDLNGHTPSGTLRGGKYSIFEGGTRVPFIARWPGKIKPGVSDALVCQVDFLSSFAALTGATVPDSAGPDSLNTLAALLGEDPKGRDTLVEHSGGLALRKANWKFVPKAGKPVPAKAEEGEKAPAAEGAGAAQLFDLKSDLSETKNVAKDHADVVKEMGEILSGLRDAGKSRK